MPEQMWWAVILVSVGFVVLLIAILSAIGVLIYTIFEMKKMAYALNLTLKATEERVTPLIIETERFVRSMRRVVEHVGDATDSVRGIADAGKDVIYELRALSHLLNGFGDEISLKALGVKAGVKTAIEVLINQIKNRR